MLPALIPVLAPVIKGVFDSLFPDPDKAAKAQQKLMEALLAADLGQLSVNRQEAAHRSLFVAGWRPWIGWVCGVGLAWTFVAQPFLVWLLPVFSIEAVPPEVEVDYLLELVLAMLGLGGLRSFEKMRGVAR